MRQQASKERNLVLKGIAGGLNACGSALVFSYDTCASGVGAVADVFRKTPGATKQLIRTRPCVKESRISDQILKKIQNYEKKVNELHKALGRKQAAAGDSGAFIASDEGQCLLADIKDLEDNIEKLKKRLVDIEDSKKANALLKQELKAYKKRSAVMAKRHRKQYTDVLREVQEAIVDQLNNTAFPSDSDFAKFKNVAEDLLDHEIEIKILAATKLGEMENQAAVPILLTALNIDESDLTCAIITSLTRFGDKGVVLVFAELLNDPHFRVRLNALTAVCDMAEKDEAIGYLKKALSDGHPEVRMAAVKLLDWQGNPELLDDLTQCVDDANEGVRNAVIAALSNIGSADVLPFLLNALTDKSLAVREKALGAIESISDQETEFDISLKGKDLIKAVNGLRARLLGTDESETDEPSVDTAAAAQTEETPVTQASEAQEKEEPISSWLSEQAKEEMREIIEQSDAEPSQEEETVVAAEPEVEEASDAVEEPEGVEAAAEQVETVKEPIEAQEASGESDAAVAPEAVEAAAEQVETVEEPVETQEASGESDAAEEPEEAQASSEESAYEELQEIVSAGESSDTPAIELTEQNLTKMVKPQLISLCQEMELDVKYTMTKAQIIELILQSR